jgi:hypothetical protein
LRIAAPLFSDLAPNSDTRAMPPPCLRGVTADALTLYAAVYQRPAADASAAARPICTTFDSRWPTSVISPATTRSR